MTLLPLDPDASAADLRRELEEALGVRLAVIVSDTFGRPWREGLTNVALGVSGMDPLLDHRGESDRLGRPLTASVAAVADELASMADLLMGKAEGVPVVLIRGYPWRRGEGSGKQLLRSREMDLFR